MKSPHSKNDEMSESLATALNSVKAQDVLRNAPDHLRDRLIDAYRKEHSQTTRRTWWMRAAAIFVIALGAGLIWTYKPEPQQNPRTQNVPSHTLNLNGEYMPLTYGMTPEESLQTVRVKLPRSALNDFGIQLKQIRSDEVTADLIVGESGVPYAIRVVQQN
jgi:hypothetical protein